MDASITNTDSFSKKAASPFDAVAEKPEGGGEVLKSDVSDEVDEFKDRSVFKSPMVTRAPFIIVNEMCERLAYYGIATNIVVYLTSKLNLTNSQAAAMVQIWSGTCYATPLIGAFVADSYWGRFWTIFCFSLVYMLGLLGLTLSAAIPSMTPEPGQQATGGMMALFWTAMYLVALGTGGIKPCVSSFGADQFDSEDPYERSLIPKFFNWFYFAINVGAVVASTVIVNLQTNVSWAIGFAIPLGSFGVAIIIFLIGSPLYRRVPPGGSPFTRMYKVLGGAVAHRKAQVPEDDSGLFEVDGDMSVVPGQPKLARTDSFKWLEKSAVEVKPPGAEDKWLVTLTEVEELKCVVRLLPVFCTLIIYNAVYSQISSLFILQGEAMDTSLGSLNVAAATVSVLDSLSVMFWVAMYDLVIAPYFAKIGYPISTLKRIGAGFFVSILSMVAAAVVEICRLNVVHKNNLTDTDPSVVTVPMSVWWQIPQYFLVGMSEVLAMIGSLELFYSQAPDAMRSTCSALQLVATACGNYLAAGLVGIVQAASGGTWIANNLNQAHIDYFFWLLAGLQAAALVVFIFVAKRFRYRNITHAGADVEALALAPSTRGALAFSPPFTRSMSHDVGSGLVTAASIQQAAHSRTVSARRRSQKSMALD